MMRSRKQRKRKSVVLTDGTDITIPKKPKFQNPLEFLSTHNSQLKQLYLSLNTFISSCNEIPSEFFSLKDTLFQCYKTSLQMEKVVAWKSNETIHENKLYSLPVELICLVVEYLDIQSAINLSLCCKELWEMIQYNGPWKQLFYNHYTLCHRKILNDEKQWREAVAERCTVMRNLKEKRFKISVAPLPRNLMNVHSIHCRGKKLMLRSKHGHALFDMKSLKRKELDIAFHRMHDFVLLKDFSIGISSVSDVIFVQLLKKKYSVRIHGKAYCLKSRKELIVLEDCHTIQLYDISVQQKTIRVTKRGDPWKFVEKILKIQLDENTNQKVINQLYPQIDTKPLLMLLDEDHIFHLIDADTGKLISKVYLDQETSSFTFNHQFLASLKSSSLSIYSLKQRKEIWSSNNVHSIQLAEDTAFVHFRPSATMDRLLKIINLNTLKSQDITLYSYSPVVWIRNTRFYSTDFIAYFSHTQLICVDTKSKREIYSCSVPENGLVVYSDWHQIVYIAPKKQMLVKLDFL